MGSTIPSPKDSTCLGTNKARVLLLPKPASHRACALQGGATSMRSLCSTMKGSPRSLQLEKARMRQGRWSAVKSNNTEINHNNGSCSQFLKSANTTPPSMSIFLPGCTCHRQNRLSLLQWQNHAGPGGSAVENLPANAGDLGSILVWEDPLKRKWQPTPVFLPGKSHGQRSLAGYSPWGCRTVWHNLATKQQQGEGLPTCSCV